MRLAPLIMVLGALCACTGHAPERRDVEPLYSLIDLVPGTDPASGERYDEYVRDYNLTLGDCWEALREAKGRDPRQSLSCESQPQGLIGQSR